MAIKREFLPENYEYMLLSEISNRAQKNNESYAEYITHMQAAFNCITVPISEEFKLYTVVKNLLPKYADAIAPFDIQTLAQLSVVCRRIDNSRIRQQQIFPFQSFSSYERFQPQRRYTPNRELNVVENNTPINCEDNMMLIDFNDYNQEMIEPDEICAFNVDRQRRSQSNQPPQNFRRNDSTVNVRRNDTISNVRRNDQIESPPAQVLRVMCWNCRRVGNHMFRDCREVRTIFCYKCGKPNITSRICNCSENGGRNLAIQGNSQTSAVEASPQN